MSDTSPVLAVTGGSRGIGAAVARLGARKRYCVAVGYRAAKAQAENLAAAIRADGGEAVAMCVDVRDAESVEQFFAGIAGMFGTLTAVANCAGISGNVAGILDITPGVINEVFATNLAGSFLCVQAAARRMALSRGGNGGAIVNLSSEAARFGGNRISAYAASKAGINAMTVGVARELAAEGIRLNAVSPGVIDTEQHAGVPVERRDALVASIPLGRMGRAEEVANTILWLLSEEASYVTGTVVSVAGGR